MIRPNAFERLKMLQTSKEQSHFDMVKNISAIMEDEFNGGFIVERPHGTTSSTIMTSQSMDGMDAMCDRC